MPVRFAVEAGPHAGISRRDIRQRAAAMLRALQLESAELSIVLTGDHQIQKLNRIYRGKNRPTDVLAFSQREGRLGDRAGFLLGDVVVSVPQAQRQADRAEHSLVAELTFLVAHGLLHLLGWDHRNPAEDRAMRREAERLCEAANAAARARIAAPRRRGRAHKGKTAIGANADSASRKTTPKRR